VTGRCCFPVGECMGFRIAVESLKIKPGKEHRRGVKGGVFDPLKRGSQREDLKTDKISGGPLPNSKKEGPERKKKRSRVRVDAGKKGGKEGERDSEEGRASYP